MRQLDIANEDLRANGLNHRTGKQRVSGISGSLCCVCPSGNEDIKRYVDRNRKPVSKGKKKKNLGDHKLLALANSDLDSLTHHIFIMTARRSDHAFLKRNAIVHNMFQLHKVIP